MRIGILTFWNTEDNYGQLLQNYALQKLLQHQGHETFLIRYKQQDVQSERQKELYTFLRNVYRLLPYPWYNIKYVTKHIIGKLVRGYNQDIDNDRGFSTFREKYLNPSKLLTIDELQKNPPTADAFIVGSDQVWNTESGVYFLSWVPIGSSRIAYAASFGARSADDSFCKLISPWLDKFDFVSVREIEGIDICKRAGRRDAVCLPDPTLLFSSDEYTDIMDLSMVPQERYILCYILGTKTKIKWNDIRHFAHDRRLKIVYVASQGQVDKYEKQYPTIEQWIGLVAHAEYVFTNSFHGTVFSLIFQRNFFSLKVSGATEKMNGRLTTLLGRLQLLSRMGNEKFDETEGCIDYTQVSLMLESIRETGVAALAENVK